MTNDGRTNDAVPSPIGHSGFVIGRSFQCNPRDAFLPPRQRLKWPEPAT